jgi:hypothetical protein
MKILSLNIKKEKPNDRFLNELSFKNEMKAYSVTSLSIRLGPPLMHFNQKVDFYEFQQ